MTNQINNIHYDDLLINRDLERRKIQAELLNISDKLKEFNCEDDMTDLIKLWHNKFSERVRKSSDPDDIINEFIIGLQNILIDPINPLLRIPLDEKAVLGSDGRVYGHKSLCLYLHLAPEEYRWRSPVNRIDETPFTVSDIPHPIVKTAVLWLKERKALLHSEEVENEYLKLEKLGKIPSLPTQKAYKKFKQLERIRHIVEKQESLVKEKELFEKSLEDNFKHKIESFQIIEKKYKDFEKEILLSIEEQKKKNLEVLENIKKEIENGANEVNDLNRRNRELEERLQKLKEGIDDAERESIKLSIAINELKQAIKERDNGLLGTIVKTCLIIGGCALGTHFLPVTLVPKESGTLLKIVLN
jgi:hypothetical protein